MNIDPLRSLQQRIREATGPDPDLDWEIWCALCQPAEWWGQKIESVFRDGDTTLASSWGCNTADGYRHLGCGYIGRFTTDPDGLGACKALMLEVLPGCVWERTKNGSIHVYRAAGALLPIGFPEIGEICANDCLTFIDAIISAAISEFEAKERVE
jgi:hypothetical protein